MDKAELKTAIAEEALKSSGLTLTPQELDDFSEDLISFFEILIEADKKLMKADDSPTQRDSDNTD
jgi:hypothetical protein